MTANGLGKAFYQPSEFTVLQDSYAIKFRNEHETKINQIEYCYKYIVTAINKVIIGKYDYNYKSGWNKVKFETIKLPKLPNGKINFSFMEKFMIELEAAHIRELENYLKVSGLSDYQLNREELHVLDRFNNGNFNFGEITFQTLFDHIKQGRRLTKSDQILGDIPFVMSGITNTGVVNYISNPIVKFPKNSLTIDIFWNCFYRSFDFGAGDDTGVYWNESKLYSENYIQKIICYI